VCGIVGVISAAYNRESVAPASLAVLVAAAVAPVLVLAYYSHYLYLCTVAKLERHASEMNDLFDSTLSTLALAIDAKDKHTHGHTRRVQKYARAIAEAMAMETTEIKSIADAALLHDIGKLAIPEYILNKRGALTPEEVRKMRMHPQFGVDIIANIKFPSPIADTILAHHERFDGKGYPRALRGNDIPLGARVLSVADAFDGYVSERVESQETIDGAIQMLSDGAGTAFDPDIVRVWADIHSGIVAPATKSESDTHCSIQQAKSELKMIESLAQSLEGLTSVREVLFTVRSRLQKWIVGCTVHIECGEHDGVLVVFGGRVIATISVTRVQSGLNDDERRLLHAVAATMAPHLSNAIAIEEARREAALDKLTGLANRRAFEVLSASLSRQHLSIILIDIDCFKAVNDNFGHNAGDATLIRTAAHLRAAFHDAQITCRLGGDEFLVLSFAPIRSLRAQVRRFRRMVIWDPAHEPYRKLMFGVSCGVASVPVDTDGVEQAVQRADERMYAFKTRVKQWSGRKSAASRLATAGREANLLTEVKV
jgi:diguanylate cyclase (GGDEF)-like protein/putative nucleotidyltransferase with HDIG domain